MRAANARGASALACNLTYRSIRAESGAQGHERTNGNPPGCSERGRAHLVAPSMATAHI